MDDSHIDEIIEAVTQIARGDYSVHLAVSGKNDRLDILTNGVNAVIVKLKEKEERLKQTEKEMKTAADNYFWQSEELKARNEELEVYANLLQKQRIALEKSALEIKETNKYLQAEITNRERIEKDLQQSYEKLRSTQAQLLQTGKLASIGELAAGVAHELNQPLMIMRTGAQLMSRRLKKGTLDNEKMKDHLESIEKNTKRMMNIINHLRTFSRQSTVEYMAVDINKTIQESFLMINEQFRLRSIEVKKDLSSDIPKVWGDANQLGQVVLNLLTNARDAVESKAEGIGEADEYHREIVVATHVLGDGEDTVEILVKDNGSGIPQEKLDRIFDPFYTTKEVGKGTGLGLSITYGIIQDHKGEINVSETGPGGTTFRIRLPVME